MANEKRLVIDGDVERGLREVGAQLAVGRGGLFIGTGPGGFALIVGGTGAGVVRTVNGVMVAVALTPETLRALVDRALTMLGDKPSEPPIPDGLVIQ